jgi:hypothetical protein
MAPTEDKLLELRQRYKAAYTAYRSCVEALTELNLNGEKPSAELLGKEAKALRELNEARAAYRDALLQTAFDGSIDPLPE